MLASLHGAEDVASESPDNRSRLGLVRYRLFTDSKTRDLECPFCLKFCLAPVGLRLEL